MTHKDQLLESIQRGLSEALGDVGRLEWAGRVQGGDINRAALVGNGKTTWFLKYHHNAPDGMFEAEAQALAEIAAQGGIRVPEAVTCGRADSTDWLLLEHMDLVASGPEALLGEQLAALHRVTSGQHGWARDNYIGSTPQHNGRCADWLVFWRDYRLRPQLELAKAAGHGRRLTDAGEQLLDNLQHLLKGHEPAPSLLHGDLWSGNKAFTPDGQPVIFDPASYYGDHETDIAMTELFGGFGPDFYAAYKSVYPLADGYHLRRELYKLYHVLNHLNLFGGGYLGRCENIVDGLLAQLR